MPRKAKPVLDQSAGRPLLKSANSLFRGVYRAWTCWFDALFGDANARRGTWLPSATPPQVNERVKGLKEPLRGDCIGKSINQFASRVSCNGDLEG